MNTADIQAAINSASVKKADLKKAFEGLQSHSSSFVSFTIKWKEAEDHFSAIEKSIEERFRELKNLEKSLMAKKVAAALPSSEAVRKAEISDVKPRPGLKTLCMKMNGNGLRSFIQNNWKDVEAIRRELAPALLFSSDPVTLVLDSLDGFLPSKTATDFESQSIRKACLTILECLYGLAPKIEPLARARALKAAVEWKAKINDVKDTTQVALSVLYLIATFEIVDSFVSDDILDLVVYAARQKNVVDVFRKFLLDEKVPDLIEKLKNSGRHLDAIKFVIAYNLKNKYPPTGLVKSFLKQSKEAANQLLQKGKNSTQAKNEAVSKEIAALKAVVKVVEEYDLKSAYQSNNFQKRLDYLQREVQDRKLEKKRGAAVITAPTSDGREQKQHNEQLSKRPRLPSLTGQQLALHDRAPHAGLGDLYTSGEAPSLYNFGNSSLYSHSAGIGGAHAPPKPYSYASDSKMGSLYYDWAGTSESYPQPYYSNPYL